MEPNSIEINLPEAGENTAAETAAAPVRRRASRRVTAAAGEAVALPAAEVPAAAAPQAEANQADVVDGAEPKKRVSRARKKVDVGDDVAADVSAAAATESTVADAAETAPSQEDVPAAKKPPVRRKRQTAAKPEAATGSEDVAVAESGDAATAAADVEATVEPPAPRKRSPRSRARKPLAETAEKAESAEVSGDASDNTEASRQSDDAESSEKSSDAKQENGNGRNGGSNGANGDASTRSSRTRQRERKRRGGTEDEPEITEDDVLLPIAGILDVLDNYAFVRTSGYLPGTGDVYVSLGQVKKYGLRKGDAVVGAIRQPRENDGGGRQKYNAIVKVDTVNSKPVDDNQVRPDFADLTPIYPNERLRLETDAATLGSRVIDLFAPIGKGQRGLIVGPHESGKSTALQQIAHAVAKNQPDAHLMLVLVDERPEEVTELQRTVNGEVIASTFDRPAEDHATIAELSIERAKRLVELGHDVIVLIDSLTSLARAYNLAAPASVRVPAGSLDAAAVLPMKRLLSAARNIENGGSLTIIATASAQPDSRLDEALLGELEGVANMQLRLSGDASDRRVFPAVDLTRSSTRNSALLTSEAEVKVLNQLRHALADENQEEGLESVLKRLGETSSNVEFLTLVQRGRG